jgi:RimJ/RimL family protein N-acetyltransferase
MYFFSNTPDWDTIELGWRFKRSAWGKGFATEAARAVMKGVQSRCAVQCFSAIADSDNKASIAVMKKLGMQYLKRELIRDTIGNFDVVVYRKNCSDVSL